MAKPLSALLVAILMLPSVSVGAVGLHLALDHHHHAGAQENHAHEGHADDHARQASTLAEIAYHGHEHDEAQPADHSHDVPVAPSKLSVSLGLASALSRTVDAHAADPLTRAADRALGRTSPPPLYTSHCSLLL